MQLCGPNIRGVITFASMSLGPFCELALAACLSTDSLGVPPNRLLVSLNPAASAPPTNSCSKNATIAPHQLNRNKMQRGATRTAIFADLARD